MAENPLLPHRRLKELYALMLRCRELDRQHKPSSNLTREALLAAVVIQLEPGDFLCGDSGDRTVQALAGERTAKGARSTRKQASTNPSQVSLPEISRLTLAAGIARGLQSAGTKSAVVVLAPANWNTANWSEALTCAQEARLPLVLLCLEDAAAKPRVQPKMAFSSHGVSALAKHLRLPLLSVDGEDGVAMYRVMQEALLRARAGDGPAILWAAMSSKQSSSESISKPVLHMQQYLAARGLLPAKRSIAAGK